MNQEGMLMWGIVGVLMLLALGSSAWAGDRKGRQGRVEVHQTVVVQSDLKGPGLPSGWSKGKKTGWAQEGRLLPPGHEQHLSGKKKASKQS